MPHKKDQRSLLGGCLSALSSKLGHKRGFSLTELLIALAIVAVIAVLLIPVITTRAQNKSFAVSYDTEVKQMINSLESLPVSENKEDIESTMMFVKEGDIAGYANNAGAYINKYMKVAKYCGDTPGDCFASMYYLYNADNERVEFPINGIKGACALLKNGVSICLKPQIKRENGAIQEIQGWIDLNGPKEPNIYGRDLRTFTIDLKNRAIYTNEATKVLIIKPDPVCEGKDCGCVGDDCDPCKIDDRSEACCKQEGYVARAVDEAHPDPDPCCPYFKNEAGANHDICFGPEPPCDPDTDPTCEDYCFHHTILGPDDECCAVLSAKGVANPNCCTNDSDSDYCCSIHPETEKCCKKRIDNGKLQLTADNVCCTKYQSIYNAYDVCKPVCEVDNNSEKCCNTVERRNKINNPDDQCCRFGGVNGLLDAASAGNSYNQYCCRLPKNASEQCCKWKYDHIGSSLDYYTKHDYNQNGGTFDGCCHGNVRGIKYMDGKTDSKSQAVLSRCCTLNSPQADADEDRICCDYLVSQKGNSFLKHGQALRRCCKYNNHKNKPECCSHENDGMAFSADVSWASQCCMPNSLYPNNVKPDLQCCFVNTSITNESNSFWQNRRWTDCCSYGGQTYNGHKANTEAQWQKNCCSLTRAQYPSDAAYNAACCVANATAKGISPSRDSWHYFSQTKNECCETLDNQYGESGRNENWTSNCCYGWKGGNFATKNPYYNQEAKCCMLDGNWTEACCTLSKIDKGSAKWKKNCCDNPTLYNKNSVYRENCCDTNATDYTRKNHGADTQTGLNGKNVDLSKHKEYCCHPDAVDPNVECCKLYSSSDDTWNDRDSNTISMDYQIKCCEKSPSAAVTYCPNSCHVRWETSKTYNYDFSRCCKDRALATNQGSVNRTKDIWRNNCCAYAPVAQKGNNDKAYVSFEDYRKGCCKSGVEQTFKDGNDGSNQNNINCCIPNGVTATVSGTTTTFSGIIPTEDCCRAFSNNGWKDFDSVTLNPDYKIACCAKYKICDDSCEIRSKANRNDDSYNLPSCCKNSDMQSRHKGDKIWQEKCCDGSTSGTSTNNTLTDDDYRTYCCNKAGEQDGNKVGGQDMRCCKNVGASKNLRNQYCCTNVPAGKSGDTKLNEIGYHCDCSTGANTWNVVNKKYLTTCCTDSTVLGRITSNSATKEDWKSKCCSENIVHKSTDNTIRGRHYSYCCNDGGPYSNKSTWLNSTCCKTDNKSSASKSTEGVDWGNVTTVSACCYYHVDFPTETCCSAKASSASWNNDVSTRDTGYKQSCCDMDNKYCSCGSKLDKSLATTDTCCNVLKTTDNGKARWQSDCCKYRSSYPSNTIYRNNCCSGDGVNNTTSNPSSNGNAAKYCCNPNATSPTKACCEAFEANGWNDWDGNAIKANNYAYKKACCAYKSIDDTCCDLGFTDKCSCAKRIAKGHSLDLKINNVNCCYETRGSRSSSTKVEGSNKTQGAHWKSQCCKYSNPGGLTDSEFKSYSCCKNGSDGLILDGNNSSLCCDNSCTLSSFCCATGSNPKQCTCEERKSLGYYLNTNACGVNCCPSFAQSDPSNTYVIRDCCASYTNNQSSYKNWAANCCTTTKEYSNDNWKNACCPSPSSNYSGLSGKNYKNTCCLSPRGGNYYGGGSSQSTTCCSTDYKESAFCCSKLGKSYCTCDLQWTYYKSSFDTGCCDSLKSHASDSDWQNKCCTLEGHVTGKTWLDNCCSVANINSAVGTDLAGCCAKLKSTSSLFSPGSKCCIALNVDSATGKSSVDNQIYSGCMDECNLDSTFGSGDIYYETTKAKECCNNGYGKPASDWNRYCCRMRKSSDAWTYSGSSYYSAPNGKCCSYRKSSNEVYAYVPSYMSSSKQCPAGGEKNKCASFLDTSLGFYCGSEDSCTTWSKNQNADVPSTNLDACCERLYNKGLISSSTNATDNSANYYQEAKNLHYKACCRDAAFRGTTNGTQVCCTSEPPEDMHDVGKACCQTHKKDAPYCKLSFSCTNDNSSTLHNSRYNTTVSCTFSGYARNYVFQINTSEVDGDILRPRGHWYGPNITKVDGASPGSADYTTILYSSNYSFYFSNIGGVAGYQISDQPKPVRGCFIMKYKEGPRDDIGSYPWISDVGNRAGYGACHFYIGDKLSNTNCCGVEPGSHDCCSYSNFVPNEYR